MQPVNFIIEYAIRVGIEQSKKEKNIFTMKSLILAQDER